MQMIGNEKGYICRDQTAPMRKGVICKDQTTQSEKEGEQAEKKFNDREESLMLCTMQTNILQRRPGIDIHSIHR